MRKSDDTVTDFFFFGGGGGACCNLPVLSGPVLRSIVLEQIMFGVLVSCFIGRIV